MKYAFAVAAVMVAMISASAFAADGRVSQAQLANLGLSGMEVMSDVEGQAVRGQGFAFVSSVATSTLPGTSASNTALALGFNHADGSTAATSELTFDFLLGVPTPILSLQIQAAVGSAGYGIANSN